MYFTALYKVLLSNMNKRLNKTLYKSSGLSNEHAHTIFLLST